MSFGDGSYDFSRVSQRDHGGLVEAPGVFSRSRAEEQVEATKETDVAVVTGVNADGTYDVATLDSILLLDGIQDGDTDHAITVGANRMAAVRFTAPAVLYYGRMVACALRLKTDVTGLSGTADVHLYSDNAGVPDASLGLVGVMDVSEIDADGYYWFWQWNLGGMAVDLAAGTDYWVVLDLASTTGNLWWWTLAAGVASNLLATSADGGSTWTGIQEQPVGAFFEFVPLESVSNSAATDDASGYSQGNSVTLNKVSGDSLSTQILAPAGGQAPTGAPDAGAPIFGIAGVIDAGTAYQLEFLSNSVADFTANRSLTFDLANASRALIISGDSAINQDVRSSASPTFADPTVATLHLLDTNSSHDLILKAGSDLTADRILTLTTGDAARTITISGDSTISQDYSATGNVQFATLTLNNDGLHLLDTNASHDLIIKPGSDLTADRILTITTGDAARTFTLSGDLTVESASLINQDLTTDSATAQLAALDLQSGTLTLNGTANIDGATAGYVILNAALGFHDANVRLEEWGTNNLGIRATGGNMYFNYGLTAIFENATNTAYDSIGFGQIGASGNYWDNGYITTLYLNATATHSGATAGVDTQVGGHAYTPSANQVIDAAADAILANAVYVKTTNTTGGSITLTSTPTIANGVTGQVVIITNVGADNVVIQDQGTLAGSNLELSAASITIGQHDYIMLIFDGSDWRQLTALCAT